MLWCTVVNTGACETFTHSLGLGADGAVVCPHSQCACAPLLSSPLLLLSSTPPPLLLSLTESWSHGGEASEDEDSVPLSQLDPHRCSWVVPNLARTPSTRLPRRRWMDEISGGLIMSAREKTKDSVSLLPCFYFVEVGSSRMSQSCAREFILLHMHAPSELLAPVG